MSKVIRRSIPFESIASGTLQEKALERLSTKRKSEAIVIQDRVIECKDPDLN